MAGGGVALVGLTLIPLVRPALRLMSQQTPREARHTGTPGKEVIPVDLWRYRVVQELLIDGIISNLTGMFDTLNTKVGEIAGRWV